MYDVYMLLVIIVYYIIVKMKYNLYDKCLLLSMLILYWFFLRT